MYSFHDKAFERHQRLTTCTTRRNTGNLSVWLVHSLAIILFPIRTSLAFTPCLSSFRQLYRNSNSKSNLLSIQATKRHTPIDNDPFTNSNFEDFGRQPFYNINDSPQFLQHDVARGFKLDYHYQSNDPKSNHKDTNNFDSVSKDVKNSDVPSFTNTETLSLFMSSTNSLNDKGKDKNDRSSHVSTNNSNKKFIETPNMKNQGRNDDVDSDDSNNTNVTVESKDNPDLLTYQTNLQLAVLAQQCSSGNSKSSHFSSNILDNPSKQHQSQNNTAITTTFVNPKAAAKQALHILRNMTHPDTVAYNSVIKALAKIVPAKVDGVPASLIADGLLEEMKQLQRQQTQAKLDWYERLSYTNIKQHRVDQGNNSIINNINESKGNNIDSHQHINPLSELELQQGPPRVHVKPNVRTYSTVMDAYARHGDVDSANRAAQLLHELEDLYEATSDPALKPNLITYNTLLTAYAKCDDHESSIDACISILKNMPVEPDVISYNAVLHAVARSGGNSKNKNDRINSNKVNGSVNTTCSGAQALAWLRSMPVSNARSYTTCMDAFSRVGRPLPALSLLEELLDLYENAKAKKNQAAMEMYKPNAISFSTVIHAFAVSDEPDKAQQACAVFQRMQDYKIQPNIITYNNLLNACASSVNGVEDLALVKRVYRDLLQHGSNKGKASHIRPDQYTYGTLLKACSQLLVKDVDWATELFEEACQHGVVSKGVLWQLRQAVPMQVYRQLVGTDKVQDDTIPATWRRNIREMNIYSNNKALKSKQRKTKSNRKPKL